MIDNDLYINFIHKIYFVHMKSNNQNSVAYANINDLNKILQVYLKNFPDDYFDKNN